MCHLQVLQGSEVSVEGANECRERLDSEKEDRVLKWYLEWRHVGGRERMFLLLMSIALVLGPI